MFNISNREGLGDYKYLIDTFSTYQPVFKNRQKTPFTTDSVFKYLDEKRLLYGRALSACNAFRNNLNEYNPLQQFMATNIRIQKYQKISTEVFYVVCTM